MSILLPGTLGDIHPSARNNWFIEGAKWFNVDQMQLGRVLKDTHKKYKGFLPNAKRQAHYCKTNFSYDKMKELLGEILDKNVKTAPKQVQLQLPKLKKIGGENKLELPKLKLPKLSKIKI
jgi:hypothetical protein